MSAQTPQCLLAFYTIGLALGDEPTLSANSAEDATLDDLLAETLQQLILAFIGSQNYACHFSHPLPCLQIVQQNTERPLFYRSGHFLSMGFLKDVSIFRQFCGCGVAAAVNAACRQSAAASRGYPQRTISMTFYHIFSKCQRAMLPVFFFGCLRKL